MYERYGNHDNKNQPIYMQWWLYPIIGGLCLIFLFIGVAIGKNSSPQSIQPTQQAMQAATALPTAQPTQQTIISNNEIQQASNEDEILTPEVILIFLQASLVDVADVGYVENIRTFTITPTDPAFEQDIVSLINGDYAALEEWNVLVQNCCDLSSSVGDYSIAVLNPTNTENTLLTVYKGVVLYNCMDS